ncbi:cytochrome P450 [Sedimentitalea sp. JM2-8]|uniref:Cytochrome P450 n=1 Tax=Sedimentitalea xiamensis TaxID=3050037 RepID=A0ABT7FGE8_9RHOB|nr:cytochrome P450 [Sedimentitalea xiamensis]MDK3074183.1 cytochrome P450 [Sedimentitalea xiamensis]
MIPPKPAARSDRVSLRRYMRLFREDILSAQPARLYRAWMAEFRTPFFRSFLINQPELIREVLRERPEEFPKSERIGRGLRPLLGNSVFLSNGAAWRRQRRIIDPAFAGGRLRDTFPAMQAAAEAARARLFGRVDTVVEIENAMSHAAADVIFRTLFSIPIDDAVAERTFSLFRIYQRRQPILNLAALVPLPLWASGVLPRRRDRAATEIRALITQMTQRRTAEIRENRAPDDLATKIMTTADPETGAPFDTREMVDQVAIFFLAGHETSASALAWSLYLLALFPDWQDRVAEEAGTLAAPSFATVGQLRLSRDVFREALRLYPPVPMMVREARCPDRFRGRPVPAGSQLVISPWHLHRHERLWDNPDGFDPDRWSTENGRACQRRAYIPFSAGPRVCPGAGFAMVEGPLILSTLLRDFRFDIVPGRTPVPVAHLTVRSRDGIFLRVRRR